MEAVLESTPGCSFLQLLSALVESLIFFFLFTSQMFSQHNMKYANRSYVNTRDYYTNIQQVERDTVRRDARVAPRLLVV